MIHPGICDFVRNRNRIVSVLNQELEICVEENINEWTLDTTSFNFLIPILLALCVFFKNRNPVFFVFPDIVTAVEIVLQKLCRRKAHTQRVDRIKNLLFILAIYQVNRDKLNILLDNVKIDPCRISLLHKEIVSRNNGRRRCCVFDFSSRILARYQFERGTVVSAMLHGNVSVWETEVMI